MNKPTLLSLSIVLMLCTGRSALAQAIQGDPESSQPFLGDLAIGSPELQQAQYQQSVASPYYQQQSLPQRYEEEAGDYDTLMPIGLKWSKHGLTTTVLPGTDGGMGLTSVDLRTQCSPEAFPLLSLSPRFRFNFIDGPTFTDVPSRLYDTALDFSLFLPINERWSFFGGVAPGIYSDFDNMSSDAFRITGRALFNYKRSENLRFAFGFVYLDREDVSALPAVGVVWTPASMPDLKFDIMFPKPKIAYTYYEDQTRKRSLYLAGEFGGGTWAIERASGADDEFTYSDLRLLVGLEQVMTDQYTWFAEAGYVFNRSVEYLMTPELDLDDTGIIRAGIRY